MSERRNNEPTTRPVAMKRIQRQSLFAMYATALVFVVSFAVVGEAWACTLLSGLVMVLLLICSSLLIRERSVRRRVLKYGGLACPICAYPRHKADDGEPCPECGTRFCAREARAMWHREGINPNRCS